MTDYEIAEAMIALGGSFVNGLGRLWYAADEQNRTRLKAAFQEFWQQYEELARDHQTRKAEASR